MNRDQIHQTNLKPEFTRSVIHKSEESQKRPAPVSIRFSDEERKQLKLDAGGLPLGTYIKDRVFKNRHGVKTHSNVQDYELLAQVLAALGQSELFAKLDIIISQIEVGNLTLSPEAEYEIRLTCAFVLQMRDDLIYALGLRAENEL